jgi:hypothetical protein
MGIVPMMDENILAQGMAEEMIRGWDVIATGSGFLIFTDWRWPNNERIEIHVRRVAERDDLYVVTDGGELCSYLYSKGIDLEKNIKAFERIQSVVESSGAKVAEFQLVRGATDGDLAMAVRRLLEVIKESGFLSWDEPSWQEGVG